MTLIRILWLEGTKRYLIHNPPDWQILILIWVRYLFSVSFYLTSLAVARHKSLVAIMRSLIIQDIHTLPRALMTLFDLIQIR